MNVDLEALAGIIELLDQTEFTQFSYEQGDLKIAVSRGGAPLPGAPLSGAPLAGAPLAGAALPGASDSAHQTAAVQPVQQPVTGATETASGATLADGEFLVRSPLLGTFYRASKPGAPAFVTEGSEIAADTTLCIVEVMKLMNSVSSGVAGEVVRVLAHDGELVEFDQPLFVIRATA